MKKFLFVFLALCLIACSAGCGKKEQPLEEMQAPMSFDALSQAQGQAVKDVKTLAPETAAMPQQAVELPLTPQVAAPEGLPQLPPSGPFKPTDRQIQTALKNAGFYNGSIDGKVGKMTKKAIEAFQKANGLTADGKVGPKTWAALGKYLVVEPAVTSPGAR